MIKKIMLAVFLALTAIIIAKVEFFPFGIAKETVGPNFNEYRYKVSASINGKQDFLNFLKANAEKYPIDSYKDKHAKVVWAKVKRSVYTGRIGWKKVYILHYKTNDPSCNGYVIKVTSDGYVMDYRCAGK